MGEPRAAYVKKVTVDYDGFAAMYQESLDKAIQQLGADADRESIKSLAIDFLKHVKLDPYIWQCLDAHKIWLSNAAKSDGSWDNPKTKDAEIGLRLSQRIGNVIRHTLPKAEPSKAKFAETDARRNAYQSLLDTWDLIPPDAMVAQILGVDLNQIGYIRRGLVSDGYVLDGFNQDETGKHLWWHIVERPQTDAEKEQERIAEFSRKITEAISGLKSDTLRVFLELAQQAKDNDNN